MSSHLEKYFDERSQHLFNHLYDFELMGDEKSLHQLRVEMKKLKALLKFLHQQYKKHKLKKASHKLKKLFHVTGDIREYQLITKWLRDNECRSIEEVYFNERELKKQIQYFQACMPQHKKDVKDILIKTEKYVKETSEAVAEHYVDDLYEQVEKICMKDLPMKEWHNLRKRIKQWIYALDWIKKKEAQKYKETLEYYNNLQHATGDWHDMNVIENMLTEKHVYLSRSVEVQQDFVLAWEKLIQYSREKQKQIEAMLQQTA